MQNKYLIFSLLFFSSLLLSCKRGFLSFNHQDRITDTVFINLDTIRILHFNDYFSKIEIIPDSVSLNTDFASRSLSIGDEWRLRISSNDEAREDTLFFISQTQNKIMKDITITYTYKALKDFYPVFSSFSDRYFYHSILSNVFYRIDIDSLSLVPALVVDYGKKNLTPEIVKNRGAIPEYQLLEGGHYAGTINIFQNSKYYLIETWYLQHTFLTFYNKQSRQTETGVDYFSNGIILSNPVFVNPDIQYITDEALYLAIPCTQINSSVDTLYLTEESKERLSKMIKSYRNIFIKYYFK